MGTKGEIWGVVFIVIAGMGVTVCTCGGVLLYLLDAMARTVAEDMFDTPIDESKEYFAKCLSSPEFFGRNTGIILPDETKPIYMISSSGMFPPYRTEAHVVIPKSEIEGFIQENEFEAAGEDYCDPSFLWLTDDLPSELRPKITKGASYTRTGQSSTEIPVWWEYLLNSDTGDLWIQYNPARALPATQGGA